MRRLAFVVVFLFVASAALDARCLVSCWTTAPEAATDSCHGADADGPLFTSAEGCGKATAYASPFVRPSPSAPVSLPDVSERTDPIDARTFLASRSLLPVPTNPSALRTVIPLRL